MAAANGSGDPLSFEADADAGGDDQKREIRADEPIFTLGSKFFISSLSGWPPRLAVDAKDTSFSPLFTSPLPPHTLCFVARLYVRYREFLVTLFLSEELAYVCRMLFGRVIYARKTAVSLAIVVYFVLC